MLGFSLRECSFPTDLFLEWCAGLWHALEGAHEHLDFLRLALLVAPLPAASARSVPLCLCLCLIRWVCGAAGSCRMLLPLSLTLPLLPLSLSPGRFGLVCHPLRKKALHPIRTFSYLAKIWNMNKIECTCSGFAVAGQSNKYNNETLQPERLFSLKDFSVWLGFSASRLFSLMYQP